MRITPSDAFTGYRQWIKEGGHYTAETLVQLSKAMRADSGHAKADGTGRWRPSLIGHECDRVQQLSRRFSKEGDNGSWYAWSGTMLHLAFQAYLLDIWADRVRIEVPVKPDRRTRKPGVTGKMDWMWTGEDSFAGMQTILGPHIGDYKTLNSVKQVADGPRAKDVAQLGYELFTLGMDTGYLVYQERGHGGMASFLIEPEPRDFADMRLRLMRLDEAEAKGDLFPMLTECRAMKGLFKTCDFADICVREATRGADQRG